MENFGLITLDESGTMNDVEESRMDERYYALALISHEISHQWFGDLVSPKDWSHLWLNEAFAEYTQYLGVQSLYPDQSLDSMFFPLEHYLAFYADASPFSHAIVPETKLSASPFDDITYDKGAAVLQMLSSTLDKSTLDRSSSTFHKSLGHYVKKYAYSSVTTDDFLGSLDTATASLNVTAFMAPWIRKPGFPLLRITKLFESDTILRFNLTQERYTLWKTDVYPHTLWQIPVTYRIICQNGRGSDGFILLQEYTAYLNLLLPESGRNCTVAIEPAFFYSLYDTNDYDLLLRTILLDPAAVSNELKTHFMHQAFQLSLSGRLSWQRALEGLTLLSVSPTIGLCKTAVELWKLLEGVIAPGIAFNQFQEALWNILPEFRSPTVMTRHAGLDSDTWLNGCFWELGVRSGYKPYTEAFLNLFDTISSNSLANISPEAYLPMYFAAFAYGSSENFERVWDKIQTFPGAHLEYLTFTRNSTQQLQLLDFIESDHVTPQEKGEFVQSLIESSSSGHGVCWNRFRARWFDLKNSNSKTLSIVFEKLSVRLKSVSCIEDAKRLISSPRQKWNQTVRGEAPLFMAVRQGITRQLGYQSFLNSII